MRDIIAHRYQVEHKLAAGGFGAIYHATDLTIGRAVALKVLHRELATDASVVARFRREAAALAKLKSPHTLTLYDVGETEDTFYLVMELLRGESLQDVYDRTGTFGWRRMARIARGVCNSLREAHECGIVHRDLKPANIFLETHALDVDFVKVLDFGIAKVLASSELENTDLTHHGQTVGTFDYMAPEQMLGGHATTKSDVFTLGVVLYEMMTGKRPYGEAPGPASMLMALLSTTPAPLSGMPPELASIVMRCISREPVERPEVIELDDVLARVLELDDEFGDGDEPTVLEAQTDVKFQDEIEHAIAHAIEGAIDDDLEGETVARVPSPPPASLTVRKDEIKAVAAPRRTTLPGGSVPPVQLSGGLATEHRPVRKPLHIPAVAVPGPGFEPSARGSEATLAPHARGSEAAIASPAAIRGSSDGRSVPAAIRGSSDNRVAPLAIRFHPTTPVPTPKARMAAGTSPIVNERTASDLAAASQSIALVLLRYAMIATCLFALGFVIALAIASM